MVRLKDIAERAGVSIMTVSKALRGARDISATTKARLKRLAAEMGYVPDSLAQSLRPRHTHLLGLVVSAVTNPIQARIFLAIEEAAHRMGYEIVLAQTMNISDRQDLAIRRMISRRVDGLFVFPVYGVGPSGGTVFEELKRSGTPTVVLGQHASFCKEFPVVETDDIQGAMAATKHLIDLGHRRIALLAGPANSPWAVERMEGYRLALRDGGLGWDDALVFNAGATIEEGEKAALQMLEESVAFTALVGVNDQVMIGAASVLMGSGVRIPEDVSVVGFGNILMSAHFRVPLKTFHQPKYRVGEAAFNMVMQLIRKEPANLSQRLPVEMVIRSSTAPVKTLTGSADSRK